MRSLALAFIGGLIAATASAQSTDTPDLLPGESVVRVHAEASVERDPNRFNVTVTIRSNGATPREAAEGNAQKRSELLAILKSLNAGEIATELERYGAYAIYDEDDRRRGTPVGYESRQDIGVTLNSFQPVEPLIDRLTSAGFSDLQVSFGLFDRREGELAARRDAIAKSRQEADNIASALGKRVNRLLLVATDMGGYKGNEPLNSIVVTGSSVPPSIVKPAPVEIESEIYADWSLVDK